MATLAADAAHLASLIARGERPPLHAEALALCARHPRVAAAWVLAARALAGTGDLERAIECLGHAAELEPAQRATLLEQRSGYAQRLGRLREAIADLEAAIAGARSRRDTAALHARLGDLFASHGNPEAALPHLRAAVTHEPASPRLRLALAHALLDARSFDEAAEALRGAVALREDDARFLGLAARVALAAGALADSRAFAERALAGDPSSAHARDTLAHLALFAGDAPAARAHAEALRVLGEEVHALVLRAGAARLEGRDDEALADLDAALAREPDAHEALTLRGEIKLTRGDFEGARADADRAVLHAEGLLVSARILRLLTVIRAGEDAPVIGLAGYGEFHEAVRAILPDADRVFATSLNAEVADLLDRALAAMRGNRTVHATFARERDGVVTITPVHARPGPRFAARALLQRVSTEAPEALLARYDALIAREPRSALPRCHRGELLAWLGRYDDARADLTRTIEEHPHTRWAYIGLAGVESVTGDPARALETLARGIAQMNNTTGPAVYVHRGEALRRLGRLPEALADLRRACEVNPSRLSAWVNLALALHATHADEVARALHPRLWASARPLLCDAAESLGSPLDGGAPTPDAWPRLLEKALELMLGNRSSSTLTWRVGDGPIRLLAVAPRAGSSAAATTARELDDAAKLARRLAAGAR